MVILDYVILVALLLGIFLGFKKGLFKQIFALLGIVVISMGTSALSPYPNKWLSGVMPSDFWRGIVSMVITFIVLSVIYGIITKLISKLINKIPVIGWLNRLLGALFSIAVVYMIFAVIIALALNIPFGFMEKVQDHFARSWIVRHIYGGLESGKNFFGNWLVKLFMKQIGKLF